MDKKIILPLGATWIASVAAAFYAGQLQPTSSEDSASLSSSEKGKGRHTAGHSSSSNDRTAKSSRVRTSLQSASNQSAKTIQDINHITNPVERSRRLLAYIDTLSPQQLQQAIIDFRAMDMTRQRMGEYSMLLHAWGQADPTAALAYAKENTGNEFARQQILASWASYNTDAALTWARENHKGEGGNPWLVGVIKGIAASDTTLATSVMQELPYSEERGDALKEIIPHVAQLGLANAEVWLNQISDEGLRNSATSYLAESLATQDPEGTAQWVTQINDTKSRERAIGQVVEVWVERDPQQARQWFDSLSTTDQAAASDDFIESYASKDPNQAADWLDENSSAENYQKLLKSFAQGSSYKDPELALNYANELEDDKDRSRTVGRALWALHNQDPAKAEAWTQNNEVPPRIQEYLDKRKRGGRDGK